MRLLTILLGVLFAALTLALPSTPAEDLSVSPVVGELSTALDARQVLMDGSVTQCCDNCNARYSYDDFWYIFDDLCLWLGNGATLWTGQAYYTQDYYCSMNWDVNVCVRLQVQYLCGVDEATVSDANPAGAMAMDYAGCMGYFEDTIQPADRCGGAPYPGARTTTADQCWIFSVVAEDSPFTRSAIAVPIEHDDTRGLACAPAARICPIATAPNGTALEGAVANAQFGSPVEKMVW